MAEFIFGLLTTIATAATAFFAWQQQRQRVVVDWTYRAVGRLHFPKLLEFQITVRNYQRTAIEFWSIEVGGLPVREVLLPDRKPSIHPSWTDNASSLSGSVGPGEASTICVVVECNWRAALKAVRRRRHLAWTVRLSWTDRSRWIQRQPHVIRGKTEREAIERWAAEMPSHIPG